MSQPIGPSMPSVGRIVHIEAPPVTVPAIVTAVLGSDGTIAATLFPPGAQPIPMMDVEHVEPYPGVQPAAGTWHWPKVTR